VPVTVVDSRSVTLGLGAIVASCARLAATGATHDEVVANAQDLAQRTNVWGALDTLDNLKKGGRIGGAKALLASALAIKPIIEVRDGKVEQGGKQRTRSKALAFLVDKVAGAGTSTGCTWQMRIAATSISSSRCCAHTSTARSSSATSGRSSARMPVAGRWASRTSRSRSYCPVYAGLRH
jgi:DegV family protein with EDD domain